MLCPCSPIAGRRCDASRNFCALMARAVAAQREHEVAPQQCERARRAREVLPGRRREGCMGARQNSHAVTCSAPRFMIVSAMSIEQTVCREDCEDHSHRTGVTNLPSPAGSGQKMDNSSRHVQLARAPDAHIDSHRGLQARLPPSR